MPSGEPCDEPIVIRKEVMFGGLEYEVVMDCAKCKPAWFLNNALGQLDHTRSSANSMRESIEFKLTEPVVKTESNRPAREALRGLVMGKAKDASVILGGPPGTGKTFLALQALKSCILNHHITALYAPEHILVKAYRSQYDQKNPTVATWGKRFLDAAKNCKLLVIDDFGQGRQVSEGAMDAIEQIIMYRYDSNLHMVITTNRTVDSLSTERGQRVMSRLRSMTGDKFIGTMGLDWRGSNVKEE